MICTSAGSGSPVSLRGRLVTHLAGPPEAGGAAVSHDHLRHHHHHIIIIIIMKDLLRLGGQL